MKTGTWLGTALLTLATHSGAGAVCLTPLAADEPLCNAALSPAAWPISHRGPYAQGSSPLSAPDDAAGIVARHVDLPGPPVTLAMSPAYSDGGIAVWGALLGPSNAIAKIDHDTFSVIDVYVPADEEATPPAIPLGVSGAYSVADAGFNFILGRANFVEVFRDATPGDRFSAIELAKREYLPPSAFCRASDLLVGGVMLPDGHLAFATEQASIGVIPSDVADLSAANVVTLPSENGAACADPTIPDADLERVSNSLAADENGGIYMVTDAAVVKYQWDGTSLTKVWRTAYESDPPYSILRLGPGSGSTPSLMGTAHDDDRFVVITDGRELMRLVLMWRDDVPAGWQPIAPGKDSRIACEVPITFGDPKATRSLSEQSVLVRGYAAVVVNNLLTSEDGIGIGIPALDSALAALEGGNPARAPHGIERVDWDPVRRTCAVVWTNDDVSLPNAIPTMSAATDLLYAIGQRDGAWGLEAVDFTTGESRFFGPSAQTACDQAVIDQIAGNLLAPFLLPVISRLPASCENSIFAATEVGPDGTIYTGTFQGASKFTPAAVTDPPARGRAVAGVEQGEDLAHRALADLGGNTDRARQAAERAVVQLDATLLAIDTAEAAGKLDSGAAASGRDALVAARGRFLDAQTSIGTDDAGAASALAAALADLAAAHAAVAPCPRTPRSGCRAGSDAGLAIQASSRAAFGWRLRSSVASPLADFGDPLVTTDYSLCIYDDEGLRAELHVAAAPAWAQSGTTLRYDDRTLAQDGVRRIVLRGGELSRATMRLKGKGVRLPPVRLPLTAPVTTQLVNLETGVCWAQTFAAGDVRQNDGRRFRARTRE